MKNLIEYTFYLNLIIMILNSIFIMKKKIHPIRNYKNEEITKASLEFHQKHEYQFSKSRILKQV
jgi:hypothetical protein